MSLTTVQPAREMPISSSGQVLNRNVWKWQDVKAYFRASLVAQLVKNRPAIRRPLFDSWVRKIPWRRDRLSIPVFLGFPGGSHGKESACNAGDLGLIPGLGIPWRIPWRRAWQPTPVFLPGEFHGQRSLVGYSSWGHKESDTPEWLSTTRLILGKVTMKMYQDSLWFW